MTTRAPEQEICAAFFGDTQIALSGSEVDIKLLSHRDSLLPIVLATIDLLVDDAARLNTMYRYDIRIDDNTLCGITVSYLEVFDLDKTIATINLVGGILSLKSFLIIDESTGVDEAYELMPLCAAVTEFTDANSALDELDTHQHLTFLSPVSRQKSWQMPVSVTRDDHFENVDTGKIYQALDSDGKQFIEELSVVASADYLSIHKDQNIESLSNSKMVDIEAGIDHLLAALLTQETVLKALAKYFQCQSYQLRFSQGVYRLRGNTYHLADNRTLGEPTTSWYALAKKQYTKIKLSMNCVELITGAIEEGCKFDIDTFVASLLELDCPSIQGLHSLNETSNNVLLRTQISQKMRVALEQKVIGQDDAVSSLCQGYLTASLSAAEGPRVIYTFAGPPGVGKTFLAHQLSEQLEIHEQTGYEFNVFNMEHYTDQRDGMKLFGSGVQFVDANLGALTRLVRAMPRQILLFDEIEKAHPTVIQSLLSVLDSGMAKDQTSQENVRFDQCIIIFTTNLGYEVLGRNTQSKALSVFDVLKSAKHPANGSSLSPEFVNRLAKGFTVVFNQLKTNHLIKLAEKELEKHSKVDEQISFQWADNFAGFLLKTLSPDIGIRALKTQTTKLQAHILTSAAGELEHHSSSQLAFQVSSEDMNENSDISLVLLDDDNRTIELFEQHSLKQKVQLCSDIDVLNSVVTRELPDALLIDVDTLASSGLNIADLQSRCSTSLTLPIFTYRLVDSAKAPKPTASSQCVREHFELCIRSASQDEILRSLQRVITRIQYYITTEKFLEHMIKRREAIDFNCSFDKTDNGLLVSFKQTQLKQLVDSQDLTGSELFRMSLPEVKLDQVIGLERAKKRVSEVLDWIKSPHKLNQLGVSIPTGFLFAGPSGTGKTFLAQAVAGESGLPFFAVSAAELSSSNVGGTTENIKKLFAMARKYAPAIIFIDEVDAIAAKRDIASSGGSRDRNLTVNTLLTEMDGFASGRDNVFVLAATNYPEALDDAMVRPGRFDETIYCDLPNREARTQFFKRFVQRYELELDSDTIAELVSASRGMSSAELEQVFREVIYQSVGSQKRITIELIKQTMIRVTYGTPSESIVLSEQEKLRTAYHEAGHLLISALLFPNQEIQFVTIEPRNQALGFVATREEEEYESYSRQRIGHRLEVLLAGRAAELLLADNPDDISTGASNDIYKATSLAMHAIYEGGLEPSIGPINVPMITKFEESELVIQAQHAVQKWIMDAEASVIERLGQHRKVLDAIANALYERESLLAEEIKILLQKHF